MDILWSAANFSSQKSSIWQTFRKFLQPWHVKISNFQRIPIRSQTLKNGPLCILKIYTDIKIVSEVAKILTSDMQKPRILGTEGPWPKSQGRTNFTFYNHINSSGSNFMLTNMCLRTFSLYALLSYIKKCQNANFVTNTIYGKEHSLNM